MKFSVLIPVYNAEKYLVQCLDSVLAQSFTDYEVVLVNDGSTDRSGDICDTYAKKDIRIQYFPRENHGRLATRQYTLQKAQGEYILFLDADDYWKPELLTAVSRAIKETDAEIINYCFERVKDNGELVFQEVNVFSENKLFDEKNKEELWEKFAYTGRLNLLWTKCIKRNVIDFSVDYSQYGDLQGEDMMMSVDYFQKAHTVYYMNDVLYCYRLSTTGSGRNFKRKYFPDHEVVRSCVLESFKKMNLSQNILHGFYIRYIQDLMNLIQPAADILTKEEFLCTLREARNYPTYLAAEQYILPRQLTKRTGWKYRLFRRGKLEMLYQMSVCVNNIRTLLKSILHR